MPSYQSTVDMDFRMYRSYENRINKYFMETPYDELIERNEMSELWSDLSFYQKQTLRSLRVEV